MSYAANFIEYIKNKGIRSFTHVDIVIVTGTTCPHSVLKYMKKSKAFTDFFRISKEEDEPNAHNSNTHKRYFIEVL